MLERFSRFSYSIFEISRCWHRIAGEVMEQYGLRGTHAVYLVTLMRTPNITAARLCELCARDKADVSRAVSLMEKKGFLEREGSSYRATIRLTQAGMEATRRVCCCAALAVEQAGKGFTDEDRATFYRVLDIVTENMQALTQSGLPE